MRVRIDQIIPDPNQPRKTFDEEAIKELASSFESYGVISPLKVRPSGDSQYMIITGELRYRAAKQRGDKEIEVGDPVESTDQQAREMQFIENLHRSEVPPLELGEALYNYRKNYGLSRQQLADIIGWKAASIEGYEVAYTQLTAAVKKYLKTRALDFTSALAIATIEDPTKQNELGDIAVEKDLTRDRIRKIASIIKTQPDRPIADIVDDVLTGKAKEDELARLEAAKRAAGISVETREELIRGAEALMKEAERKAKEAKEAMNPEEKAAQEAEKQAREEAQALNKAEREKEKRQREEKQKRQLEERVRQETLNQAFSNPELLKIAVKKAETVLPADEVRAAIDYPSILSDKHLAEVFKAPSENWTDLIQASEKRGWSPVELAAVVDAIKDENTTHQYKAQLLQGEADPVVNKDDESAILDDTLKRRMGEALEQDKMVSLTRAWDALSKLELFDCKEVVDALDSFYLERVIKDTPRDIKYLSHLLSLARERSEIWQEVDK